MGYGNLQNTMWEIVKAGIDSEMTRFGYFRREDGGYYLAGFYVEPLGPEGGDIGGRMRHMGPQGEVLEDQGWDPRNTCYQWWVDNVPAVFELYTAFPDPYMFTSEIAAAGRAATRLACEAALDGQSVSTGNATLDADLLTVTSELAGFNGDAVNVFSRDYANRLPSLVGAEFAATCLVGVFLVAEQELFTRVRNDIGTFADQTLAAVAATRPEAGSLDIKAVVTVLGALVAAAGIVASGGGAAPVILGLGGVGASAVVDLWPSGDEPAQPQLPLGAADPRQVLANAQAALTRMNECMTQEEDAMRTRAADAANLVATHSDFDIGRPALLDETDVDQIITAGEIVEDMKTLRGIGLDVMPSVASEIVNSGVELEAANGFEPWKRRSGIGRGTLGPWSAVWDLVHAIQTSQAEVKAELVAAGEALAIAADMMTQTEEQVEERLRQHAGTVTGVGVP